MSTQKPEIEPESEFYTTKLEYTKDTRLEAMCGRVTAGEKSDGVAFIGTKSDGSRCSNPASYIERTPELQVAVCGSHIGNMRRYIEQIEEKAAEQAKEGG